MEQSEDSIRKSFAFHEQFYKYAKKKLANAKGLFNRKKLRQKKNSNKKNSNPNFEIAKKYNEVFSPKNDALRNANSTVYSNAREIHLQDCGRKINLVEKYLFIGVHVR